jgi:hypothetical protein
LPPDPDLTNRARARARARVRLFLAVIKNLGHFIIILATIRINPLAIFIHTLHLIKIMGKDARGHGHARGHDLVCGKSWMMSHSSAL